MYSFPDLEPVCCSMSSFNCCFLTCIQIFQEAGQVVWYSYLFQNFPQFMVIHIVKGFGIVNKAEIDVFSGILFFFDDPTDVGNLISGSSAFSKTSLNTWKFTVHILLIHSLENFQHYSRKSRNTWSNRQILTWSTKWSREKANRILPRGCTGHSKHPILITQEKTLHTDITRWSTPRSDWLYSLQLKMEKFYIVSKNRTMSWLWLRSWTHYCQIQT